MKNFVVPPKISPFQFARDVNFGDRTSVQCVAGTGDLPLTFSWMKDNIPIIVSSSGVGHQFDGDSLKPGDGLNNSITIRRNDEFTSALSITRVTRSHDGNYSCVVENDADKVIYSTLLRVNGNCTIQACL